MKLYKEEQVKEVYNEGFSDGFEIGERKIERTINSLTPIELPSDEQIDESETNSEFDRIDEYNYGFIDGANWVKDFIINQNK
jgi:hypothetical protein